MLDNVTGTNNLRNTDKCMLSSFQFSCFF